MERREDLRYKQKVQGHKNVKTIEIYTYLTKKGIEKITNPLDGLKILEIRYE